jgi:hypothetical protein
LSKEKFNSDEIIYLQNNEVNPRKYFPNESNKITKPKDNNGKLGHGQVFCIVIFVSYFNFKVDIAEFQSGEFVQ